MTSPEGCDGCQSETDLFGVNNRETGQAQFLGPICLASLGVATLVVANVEAADAVLKAFGYQPTAATKKARAAAEDPEYDPNRVIAEVVADKPEPPADESVETQGDESIGQQVDLSTSDGLDDGYDGSLEVDAVRAAMIEAHPVENTEPAPPY